MRTHPRAVALLLAAGAVLLPVAAARAQITVTVPGQSNLWLAGAAPGTTASTGQDNLANAKPFQVPGITLTPGASLTFSATGNVSNDPANPVTVGPDGGPYLGYTFYGHDKENGITNIVAPINSLIGVFLDDSTPDETDTALDGVDFSPSGVGTDLTLFAPALHQTFFIGDGKTADGAVHQIVVPQGATRLFLGSLDPSDQENNPGSFAVTINGAGGTPPPSTNKADLVGAFTGLKITPADTTQPKPKLKVKGSYSLTNAGTKKAKNFTLGAYLSGRPTIFGSDGKVRADVFPVGISVGTDSSGNPTLTPVLDGGVDKLSGLKLAAGAGLTLPLPDGSRVGPDFPFSLKVRTDTLPISLKGKYVVIVADAEGAVPEDNRANDEAAVGPLP